MVANTNAGRDDGPICRFQKIPDDDPICRSPKIPAERGLRDSAYRHRVRFISHNQGNATVIHFPAIFPTRIKLIRYDEYNLSLFDCFCYIRVCLIIFCYL